MMQQLFNQGAVDASAVEPAAQRIGIQASIAPNAAELRRRIMAGEIEPNVEQSRFAGTMTPSESSAEDNAAARQDILRRMRLGEAITPQEAEFAGIDSPELRQAKRLETLQPIMTAAGQRYVAQALAESRGRIDPNRLREFAETAFQQYASDREMQMLNLTPDDVQFARAYFYEAVMDAYRQQQMMDLQREVAGIRASASAGDPTRMLQRLTAIVNSAQALLRSFEQSPLATIISMYSGRPIEEVPEQHRDAVQRYKAAQQAVATANQLQMSYAAGLISDEQVAAFAEQAIQQLSGLNPGGSAEPVRGPQAAASDATGTGGPARKTNNQISALKAQLQRMGRNANVAVQRLIEQGLLHPEDAAKLGYPQQ